MNEWRFKIRIFLTALLGGLASILPVIGCTGRCGSCFQCAGLGGILAVLVAMRAARKQSLREKSELCVKDIPGTPCQTGDEPPKMYNNYNYPLPLVIHNLIIERHK